MQRAMRVTHYTTVLQLPMSPWFILPNRLTLFCTISCLRIMGLLGGIIVAGIIIQTVYNVVLQ